MEMGQARWHPVTKSMQGKHIFCTVCKYKYFNLYVNTKTCISSYFSIEKILYITNNNQKYYSCALYSQVYSKFFSYKNKR